MNKTARSGLRSPSAARQAANAAASANAAAENPSNALSSASESGVIIHKPRMSRATGKSRQPPPTHAAHAYTPPSPVTPGNASRHA